MYYILLCEALTSAFMLEKEGEVLKSLKKQERSTLSAMTPAGELDEHLKYFFEAAVIAEEMYCKPLRMLACDPKMGAQAFQKICSEWVDELEPLLEETPAAEGMRGAAWEKGQGQLSERVDSDQVKAKVRKDAGGRANPTSDHPGFQPGSFTTSRQERESDWPGSGMRDLIYKKTLTGILDALKRNIVHASARAEQISGWQSEHLQTAVSNHTLMVESIFSHMRALEQNSHTTRGPLMEAAVMAKLDPVSLVSPPKFLPLHIATPSMMRHEGREVEARYGGRRKRGAALLDKSRAVASVRGSRRQKRDQAGAIKMSLAHDTAGGVVYERGGDGERMTRELAPGERLTWAHLASMGSYLSSWVDAVVSNAPGLKWTAKRVEQQLVLVNTLDKSKALLKILTAVPEFKPRGKCIFRQVVSLLIYVCVHMYISVLVNHISVSIDVDTYVYMYM